MKAKIICGAGVFDLDRDPRDPEMVIAESDCDKVLRVFAGDDASITTRGKKYRTRMPKKDAGARMLGLLNR